MLSSALRVRDREDIQARNANLKSPETNNNSIQQSQQIETTVCKSGDNYVSIIGDNDEEIIA